MQAQACPIIIQVSLERHMLVSLPQGSILAEALYFKIFMYLIVEMNAGDILMFSDSIIYHSDEPIQGQRNSVVCCTSKSMYDYWHQMFGDEEEEIC